MRPDVKPSDLTSFYVGLTKVLCTILPDMSPTTIEKLEQWMEAPKEVEGLEFKAARSSYDGRKLLD